MYLVLFLLIFSEELVFIVKLVMVFFDVWRVIVWLFWMIRLRFGLFGLLKEVGFEGELV